MHTARSYGAAAQAAAAAIAARSEHQSPAVARFMAATAAAFTPAAVRASCEAAAERMSHGLERMAALDSAWDANRAVMSAHLAGAPAAVRQQLRALRDQLLAK